VTPPTDGLSFSRSSITITKGKVYSLKVIINPELVYENDDIFKKNNSIIKQRIIASDP
jgi:hypothetical protein